MNLINYLINGWTFLGVKDWVYYVAIIILLSIAFIVFVAVLDMKSSKKKEEKQAKEEQLNKLPIDKTDSNKKITDKKVIDKKIKAKKINSDIPTDSDKNLILSEILGFDPNEVLPENSTSKDVYSTENETKDMITLKEKIAIKEDLEDRQAIYFERSEIIKDEINRRVEILHNDEELYNRYVAITSKLKNEITVFSTSSKKEKKKAKDDLLQINNNITINNVKISEIGNKIAKNKEELRLLKEANENVLVKARLIESDILDVEKEIDGLNKIVGTELENIKNENIEKVKQEKFAHIRPYLEKVNVINKTMHEENEQLTKLKQEKEKIKSDITNSVQEFENCKGLILSKQLSSKIDENYLALDDIDKKINEQTQSLSVMNKEFNNIKHDINDYLDKNNFTLTEVINMEDKVIATLAYNALSQKIKNSKELADIALDSKQKEYDEFVAKKVKFSKKQVNEKLAYEQDLKNRLDALNKARIECAKATDSVENYFPNLTPASLITSGTGVISKDRKYNEINSIKATISNGVNESSKAQLLARLDELENSFKNVKAANEKKDVTQQPQQENIDKPAPQDVQPASTNFVVDEKVEKNTQTPINNEIPLANQYVTAPQANVNYETRQQEPNNYQQYDDSYNQYYEQRPSRPRYEPRYNQNLHYGSRHMNYPVSPRYDEDKQGIIYNEIMSLRRSLGNIISYSQARQINKKLHITLRTLEDNQVDYELIDLVNATIADVEYIQQKLYAQERRNSRF